MSLRMTCLFMDSERQKPNQSASTCKPLSFRRKPHIRTIIRVLAIVTGTAIFFFGYFGALSGMALPFHQFHVLAQFVGLTIVLTALTTGWADN